MPKIFSYLEENTNLRERDIYITLNDIKPHHVGKNVMFHRVEEQLMDVVPGRAGVTTRGAGGAGRAEGDQSDKSRGGGSTALSDRDKSAET